MSGTRYTDEFKAEAVKQVTERGHGVVEVSGVLIFRCSRGRVP
jgi:transposase-like protein